MNKKKSEAELVFDTAVEGPPDLSLAIFDAVTSKRILKTGYVRQPGGLHPSQCDTVASHTHAVSVLAALFAREFGEALATEHGVILNFEKVLLLSIFHDYGETRSGDTGAQSMAIYGACRLHDLERDALQAMLTPYRLQKDVVPLYEAYRRYSTPEALLVHAADVVEGFEKAALHFASGGPAMEDAFRTLCDNIALFLDQRSATTRPDGRELELTGRFIVYRVLKPAIFAIVDAYRLKRDRFEELFSS